jgi:Mn-dependent DtxR family transcriptional regulator
MNKMQLIKTLEKLVHYAARNEIVCEHFLTQQLRVTREEIAAKVNEIDHDLQKTSAEWLPNQLPELWEMTHNDESLEH